MILTKKNSVIVNHLKIQIAFYSRLFNQSVITSNKGKDRASYSQISDNTATLRRGTGGRSSFSGIVATVFGATGFFGKYIVNELGKIGSQVIIPYRGTAYSVRELRVMGDLGQVLFLHLDPNDDDSIRKSIKYSNVVINLIGKDNETKNYSFDKVHVDIAARIARISKEMGVEKLIHVSALSASPTVPEFIQKNGSNFLRTKGLGEIEVTREFPEAIIFRPSDMYGHNDRFLMYYQRWERRLSFLNRNYIPLWRQGRETIKQPVFGSDVAKGMINAVLDPMCNKLVIEAVGPYRYRLDHLLWWIYMTLRFPKDKIQIVEMNPLMKIKARFYEKLKPIYPPISVERLEREFHNDDLAGLPSLEDLGVTNLTNLEDRIHYELRFKRKLNYYWDAIGEIPDVPPPPRAVF